MKKRIFFTLIGIIILGGALGGIKYLQFGKMIAQGEQYVPPPETVTAASVNEESWQSLITAIGSLEAVQGVTLTAELTGKVVEIAFEPGSKVAAGDLLVQQDVSAESAQLRAAEATVTLARNNFARARSLLGQRAISKSEYDNADAELKAAVARADNIRATIAKKTIRAPFAGRIGIRQVNLGQIINEGEPIAVLQSLDPIFVNFSVPQRNLIQIQEGYRVKVTVDGLNDDALQGAITAINPQVDDVSRNITIQATLDNPRELLRPGMYAQVAVLLPESDPVLTIPETAVLYAPYGDSVFVLETGDNADKGKSGKTVRQQFVRLGRKQGDFVSVLSGVEAGQSVVTTGVFKLRNGQSVVVDNTLSPEFKHTPAPENS